MRATKDVLLHLADAQSKTVAVDGVGDIVIRRLKLRERNELLKGRGKADDLEAGVELSKQIIARALIDPILTTDEVDELPAAIVDLIAKEVIDYNGWTQEGQAAIADHFRPAP